MTLTSSRLAIGQALVALIQGITNPSTNTALYQEVKLGAVFDVSNLTSWCEIIHIQGQGAPAGSGGSVVGWRIDDSIRFQITSAVGPYETDSTAAQVNMLTIQDVLLPTLHTHFQLPNASNPTNAVQSVYSVLVDQPDRSRVGKFPNGHVFLLWDAYVIAKQQYNIELQVP